jgi:hypothetical protein
MACYRYAMPASPIKGRWIAVVERSDGRMFTGNVEVTIDGGKRPRLSGSWRLSEETALGLGLASRPIGTWVVRSDAAARLHRCRICRGFFIAHHAMRLCSDTCAKVNRQAWVEAHRWPPPQPSKAAQRRNALASARCRVCGGPFQPMRLSARFCSNRCRQKHHRVARMRA